MNRLPAAVLAPVLAGFMIAHAPAASAHEPVPQAAQEATTARSAPQTEVLAVLQGYRASLSALDAPAAARFFWPDSQVFEQGGVEGDFARYLEHHLGPELLVFSAFEMIDPVVRVVVAGDTAYATETYRFRIAFKDAARARSSGKASPPACWSSATANGASSATTRRRGRRARRTDGSGPRLHPAARVARMAVEER